MALSTRTRRYSRYEEFLPYPTPNSLDEFRGPSAGIVRVDHNICTSPNPVFDLSDERSVKALYAAAIREGSVQQQLQIINLDRFLELWPDLNLPGRCLDVWETKFPQLIEIYESTKTA